jgi:hypothetical protein
MPNSERVITKNVIEVEKNNDIKTCRNVDNKMIYNASNTKIQENKTNNY